MTDHDAFEIHLTAAVRGYVGHVRSDLDPVELAHRIATREPRRRGLLAELAWRDSAIPSRIWVPLLLVALLAAMVGGMLVAGSQPAPRVPAEVPPPVVPAFACPPGSTPDEPGPVDQGRPPGFSGMAFDRRAGRLIALSGADTWTFNVCTNTWLQMPPTRERPTSLVGPLVYDVDSDVTIGVSGPDEAPGNLWVYDLKLNTWREAGPFAPFANPTLTALRFYDPVTGRVVALRDDGVDETLGLELWGYEVETDTWTPVGVQPITIGPHYEFFAYDTAVDRLVAYAQTWAGAGDGDWAFGARTWLFNLRTGTWATTGAATPGFFDAGMWGRGAGMAYDEAAERTVMMGQGHLVTYDAAADRWETLWAAPTEGECGIRPECRQVPDLIFDSVNGRLIVYGGSVYTSDAGWVDPEDLSAFDLRTRTWKLLLALGSGQPAPSLE
jgi:hypothetical protein